MTSLGRVGRILAGTIDVSNSTTDKDTHSSNASTECSANTSSPISAPVETTEQKKTIELPSSNQINNKDQLEGIFRVFIL